VGVIILPDVQPLTIRLEKELHEELRTIAFFGKTAINEIINDLVRKYLADVKKPYVLKS
jgi:hypothetical protein